MEPQQRLKEITDRLVLNAEIILKNEKQLTPTIFVFSDLSKLPTPIRVSTVTDEDQATLLELIRESANGAEALILLITLYTRDVIQEKGAPRPELPVIGDLKGHSDTLEAITAFVYTKGGTAVRRVAFVEKEGEYTFCDMGWEDSEEFIGMFANPFEYQRPLAQE
jgi:hypothetical protein